MGVEVASPAMSDHQACASSAPAGIGDPRRRSIRVGVIAAAAMTIFYVGIVGGASGSLSHLGSQIGSDWYLLALIIGGFGAQVGLMSELRRRRRLGTAVATASAAGAGASGVGMIACCAHHIADLLPFIGATGAAAFLTEYRIPFMVTGIGINAVGITIAYRRVRRSADPAKGAV